jgi:putrescine importer
MLLTAISYARFSRCSERPGSAYSYTAESCGATAGFLWDGVPYWIIFCCR